MTKLKTEEDEEDRVLKDGQVLRVPLSFMDSAQREVAAASTAVLMNDHRPHFGRLTAADAQRRDDMYRDADQRLSRRWRGSAEAAASINVHQTYDEQISNRWRAR